jgi:hypothetical protein
MRIILAAAVALLAIGANAVSGTGFSSDVELERFTITPTSIEYEVGHLLKNGQFQAFETVPSGYLDLLGVTPDDVLPFSGKPVVTEDAYNTAKMFKRAPSWIRSKQAYPFLGTSYVIVAVKGKGDPNPAIAILEQPTSQNVLVGGSAFFLCNAEPHTIIDYQWKFRGKKLAGQTSSSLEVDNVTKAQTGIYKVSMTTGSKPVTSKPALLRLVTPVTIKTEPKSQTVRTGKGAAFRVTPRGTGPFAYEWFYNGTLIPQANKSFYAIPHVTAGSAGDYSVTVSNALSSATSTTATLTVTP